MISKAIHLQKSKLGGTEDFIGLRVIEELSVPLITDLAMLKPDLKQSPDIKPYLLCLKILMNYKQYSIEEKGDEK